MSGRFPPRGLRRRLALSALLLTAAAQAQQQPAQPGWPQPVDNDALFGYAVLNQNEWRAGDGQGTYRWDGEGSYGDDLNRAWFRTEGSLDIPSRGGGFQEAEAQLLYSRAVSAFFNLQAGGREQFAPGPARSWAAFGIDGLLPLFWDFDALGFVSDGGHAAARVEGDYDLRLTQRLILQPQFEINAYSSSDPRRGLGSGLSDLDSGLRLRYEIRRELAPYVGVNYENKYGQTAGFARRAGAPIEQVRFAAGLRVRL